MFWRLCGGPSYQALTSTVRAALVVGAFALFICWFGDLPLTSIVEWPLPTLWGIVALLWCLFQYAHTHADVDRRRRWVAHQRYAPSVQRDWGTMHPADRAIARGRLETMARESLERCEPPPHLGNLGYAWHNDLPPFGDGGQGGQ